MPHDLASNAPNTLFIGPIVSGDERRVVSQDAVVAGLMASAGIPARTTSPQAGRLHRLCDMIIQIARWRDDAEVAVISVFSGPGFVLSDIASAEARLLGLPVAMVLRGGDLPAFASRHPRWVDRVLRRASALVAPSSYLAGALGRPDRPVEVIPNVIDLDLYPFKHRSPVRPRLIWMRSFHDVYHPHLALDVLERLLPVHPEASLTMAGPDGGILDEVRRRTENPPLAGRVHFVGFLDAAGKQREFARHDIFLNTNRIDNMPVSVVEAVALGLPVVATAVGGIPDLLEDESTALLVPPDDPEAMAAAVSRLLDDPELAEALSTNGRALAERSGWPRVREQWLDLLDHVARSGR